MKTYAAWVCGARVSTMWLVEYLPCPPASNTCRAPANAGPLTPTGPAAVSRLGAAMNDLFAAGVRPRSRTGMLALSPDRVSPKLIVVFASICDHSRSEVFLQVKFAGDALPLAHSLTV